MGFDSKIPDIGSVHRFFPRYEETVDAITDPQFLRDTNLGKVWPSSDLEAAF